jgi:hypothetical protein
MILSSRKAKGRLHNALQIKNNQYMRTKTIDFPFKIPLSLYMKLSGENDEVLTLQPLLNKKFLQSELVRPTVARVIREEESQSTRLDSIKGQWGK